MAKKFIKEVITDNSTLRFSDLALKERHIYKGLPLFKKINAFIFGGVYGCANPVKEGTHEPRVAVVYIPPMHVRFYYKVIYRIFVKPFKSNNQK